MSMLAIYRTVELECIIFFWGGGGVADLAFTPLTIYNYIYNLYSLGRSLHSASYIIMNYNYMGQRHGCGRVTYENLLYKNCIH